MTSTNTTILVTGATGNQGGATARALLADGWAVRALTRDPRGPAARALAAAGALPVGGDLDDRDSLDAALAGVHGVFAVQRGALASPPVAVADEIRRATSLVDAARDAGVAHLVQASVAGADHPDAPAAFAAKYRIERHLRASGVPATILRPVSFMDNYVDPAFGLRTGTLATALAADVPEQLIAVADIGAVAAAAFRDPARHLHRTHTLAGDAVTPPRIAAELGAAADRVIEHRQVPVEALRALNADAADAIAFLNAHGGYGADLAATRAVHPGLMDLRGWLAATGRAALIRLLDPARRR